MAPKPPSWSWLTKRVKLVVAYDGTDFRGWAAQAGRRTVQSTLTEAIRRVSGERIEIVGASRTDSGAHAEGQVCHFDTEVAISLEKWVYALNRVLPLDIRVRSAKFVKDDFNSRFSAKDRRYHYVWYRGERNPRAERYAVHWDREMDLKAMQLAAKMLEGRHDFRAFTAELDPTIENTRRTLHHVRIFARGNEVIFNVVGDAFLRGMMRRMAGAIQMIGLGQRDEKFIKRLLDPRKRDQETWPVVLPARGLTLMEVRYGPHPKDSRKRNDAKRETDGLE